MKVYPNDDPDTAAKKYHEDNKNHSDESKPKTNSAYKYSRDIPLAEEIELGNQNVFFSDTGYLHQTICRMS